MASNVNTQIIPVVSFSLPSSTSTNLNFSTKLTSHNYLAWKTQLLPLLNSQDLTNFIDGTTPAPPTTIPSPDNAANLILNPAYQPWFKKDQLLLFWILSSLSEEVFPYVTNVTSSYVAWQILMQTFGVVS